MSETTLPVEHLFTLTATLRPESSRIMNGPQGSRVIAIVTGGTFEGPGMRGVIDNSGGDWVTMRADGSIRLDVRILLHTDDGADILMTYKGVGVPGQGGLALRTAPLFETGDERYAYLNNIQAVATGTSANGTVTYKVYALK